MEAVMLGLIAESPVHPGTGRSTGVVDLPVAREAATDYPVLVGSSLKGALRDKAQGVSDIDVDTAFGRQDSAGGLLISDGRLLFLPVRSLDSSYKWATCPLLVERYRRDLARAGLSPLPDVPVVAPGEALGADDGTLYLEERRFESTSDESVAGLADASAPLILHEDTRERLSSQIVVLHDSDFAWFARYGLSIQARNVLKEDGTKQSQNLWYEEALPADTVMYGLILGRDPEILGVLGDMFGGGDPYLQVGGNETVGHGWFAVHIRRSADGGA